MAKTNDSIQHATDTTQQAHDSVAQFTPLYPDGIPAVQGNDSVVSHLADLPVMESPKPLRGQNLLHQKSLYLSLFSSYKSIYFA